MDNHKNISDEELKAKLNIGVKKRSFLIRYRFLWLALLIISAGTAFYLKSTEKEKVNSYITTKAQKGDIIVTVSATGNLEPTNTVDVGIEVSGTVAEVLADYNDRVKKGDILAKLDTTKLLSKVNNSNSSLVARPTPKPP